MLIKSKGQKIFNVCNIIFMLLLSFVFVAPYLMIISASFSDEISLVLNGYSLFPKKWSFEAYKFIFTTNQMMLRSIWNSIEFTVLGTLVSTFFTLLYAYPLSRKSLHFKKFFNIFILIPMLFGAGLIPTYLVITTFFEDSYWAIIIPGAVVPWYIILIRNYCMSLPDSFEEAAKLDGAGNFTVLFRIYLPLMMPIIATIALYNAVNYWNNWVGPMLYITDKSKYPLQYVVQQIMLSINNIFSSSDGVTPTESVKMACVVIGSLPIIIVYPFLQKYFINGTIVGGVKE